MNNINFVLATFLDQRFPLGGYANVPKSNNAIVNDSSFTISNAAIDFLVFAGSFPSLRSSCVRTIDRLMYSSAKFPNRRSLQSREVRSPVLDFCRSRKNDRSAIMWGDASGRETIVMPTTLNIDPELLQAAIALDSESSIDAIVEQALRRHIEYFQQLKITELFGTIDYQEDYNYKQQRSVSWVRSLIPWFGH